MLLYPDVSHQNSHTPYTFGYLQLFPFAYVEGGGGTYRSEEYLFVCVLLSLLTFAILGMSQHICVDASKERVTKVEQCNMLMCMELGQHRNKSTIVNMSA